MTSLTLAGKNNDQKRTGELLRQDTAGRVRTSKERREELLAEFDRSGVSGARFAQMAGIKYPTFATWLHERRAGRSKAAGKARKTVTWVEALRGATARLRVELPGSAWMEVGSEEQAGIAALLLRKLAKGGAEGC
jgi:hypothetical protein